MSDGRIFDPRRSAIVLAGAGTGKTYRLVRRYLKIVATADPNTGLPWAAPNQVAAVTFTRAAANEMRTRLLDALGSEEPEDDDVVLREVAERTDAPARLALSREIASAPIGTLHSLCSSLLAEFPELCGVPPDAQPLDLGKHAVELPRFVSRFVDRALADPENEHHQGCTSLLAAHSLGVLVRELSSIVDETTPAPSSWRETAAVVDARNGFSRAQWRWLLGKAEPALTRCLTILQGERTGSPHLHKVLTPHVSAIDSLRAHLHTLDLHRIGADLGVAMGLSRKKGEYGASAAAAIGELRSALGALTYCRGREVIARDPPVNDRHAQHIARFVTLGLAVREAYAQRLLATGRLRYDDIEDRTLTLLRHSEATRYLNQRFRHILVDEFQDTNDRQVEIVDRLAHASGGAKTFFVGDPKQSIYAFRGADVSVFIGEIERAKARDASAVATIAESRRASPQLARVFNRFFPPIFAGGPELSPPRLRSEQRHSDDDASVPWDRDVETVRSVSLMVGEPLWLSFATENWAERVPEWERVAELIRLTLKDNPTFKAQDVAILVPKWRMAEAFRAALEVRGIPAQLAGGRGLLPLPEVRDLINLVRYWGRDDADLAAVGILRGPLVGLSDLGLYVLARWPVERREDPGDAPETVSRWGQGPWPLRSARPLAQTLQEGQIGPELAHAALREGERIPPGQDAAILGRLERDALCLSSAQPKLAELSARAGTVPTADLLAEAIVGFELEAHWLASPRGRRAVANAWKFVEIVRALEDAGPDLEGLCAWLDSGTEPAPEGLLTGEGSAVTITTYHGAKGKEWPAVCVTGLGEQRRAFRSGTWSGVGVRGSDGSRYRLPRLRVATHGFSAEDDPLERPCSAMEAAELAAESKRLLYVAMTRARDRVILSGDISAWHHLREEDKRSIGLWGKSLEREGLDGEVKPAHLCRSEGEYTVSVLGLVRQRDNRLNLRRAADWRDLVRVFEPLTGVVSGPPVNKGTGLPELIAPEPGWLDWRAGPAVPVVFPATASRHELRRPIARWDLPAPRLDPIDPPPDLDPRALGDLFHKAMQDWNFEGPVPAAQGCVAAAALAFPGRAEVVGPWLGQTLSRVLEAPIYGELLAARERGELIHEVPVDGLSHDDGARRRIRGRIDLLWRDVNGLWNVLDYKVTSRVTEITELEELTLEYGPQLALYREVLSRWRPAGEVAWLGRFGLYLAPAGRSMWVADWG